MKIFKINLLCLIATVIFMSCSSDDNNNDNTITDETENFELIQSFQTDDYTIDLYNESGNLKVGYNSIYLQVQNEDGEFIDDAAIEWEPMMTMEMDDMTHEHSSPYSSISKVEGKETLYRGYIVFIMESDEMDTWNLRLRLNQDDEIDEEIEVVSGESDYHKTFVTTMGTDDEQYYLALIEPEKPKIGTNDITVGLFKQESMDEFPIVDDFKIKVDPRMPGMDNHSAPGNEDMTQDEDGFYQGKVGFSMTGYWKINLILENEEEEVLSGEEITEENEESSIHFKLEF